MFNNPEMPVVQLSSLRYAAVQQILGTMTLEPSHEAECCPAHAIVYPASGDAEGWVVEAAATDAQLRNETKTFTGIACLLKALEHAHSTYGSVSYISR